MSLWKRFRYRLEWLGLLSLAKFIPLLSRKEAYWLAMILGSLAFHVDYRGRRTARENLRAVYRDTKSEDEIVAIAKDAFRNFARTVVDGFWSPRLTAENFTDFCEVVMDDPEAIEQARETGAIWVTPHYSNFEWIALAMGFRGFEFTVVGQNLKNPHLTKIIQENREVSGHNVISSGGALLRLLKNLKNKGHAAFLTDLTIKPTKAATIIECFGFKSCVTAIHAQLLKRTGLPVIPGICIPKPDGTYLLRGFPPLKIEEGATDQEIAQLCWDAFEPFMLENPAPWLWMYKHWRYRPEEDGDAYPDYASHSIHFKKLEAAILKSN